MLVSLKELMEDAEKGGYAVGAFNVSNLESLMAIMQAAEETGRGVILNYAEVHAPFLSMEQAALIMLDAAKKAKVPVCVHLDHGSSMESCIQAIRLGFTSVMLDASAEDYETNVRETKEIVRLAHSVGVTVEAELGHIFSSDMGLAESPKEAENPGNPLTVRRMYIQTLPPQRISWRGPAWMCWLSPLEPPTVFIQRSRSWIWSGSRRSKRQSTFPL